MSLRGIGTRLAAAAGSIVLARLLLPREFGVLAFGFTVVTLGGFLVDAGIGASLIRRDSEPERRDLGSVLGFQLLVTALVIGIMLLLAIPFGRVMLIAGVMTSGLLILAFRVPATILFERELSYRLLAAAEVADSVIYNSLAIALVVSGFGIWGVALAAAVRVIPGTLFLVSKNRRARVLPELAPSRLRPILSFGAQFQGIALVNLVRDEVMYAAIGALASFRVLGIVALANNLIQTLMFVFESLWRVSFPAMAQLRRDGRDAAAAVDRIAKLCLIVIAFIAVGLAAGLPGALVAVFGEKWRPVLQVIPGMIAGLVIVGPVSTACGGFLLAAGDARSVLGSAIAHTSVAWASFGFYFVFGLPAIAVGAALTCGVEAGVLSVATRRHLGHNPLNAIALPTGFALTIATAGWIIGGKLPRGLPLSLALAAAAEALLLGCYLLFERDTLRDVLELAVRYKPWARRVIPQRALT